MIQNSGRKNERIFNELYDRYAGALYGIICREVADHAVAGALLRQTFVLSWQQLGQCEQGRIFACLLRNCCGVVQEYTGTPVDLLAWEAVSPVKTEVFHTNKALAF